MNRRIRRVRLIMPFLLLCLAGGATALLQVRWPGLVLPPTGVLLLITANVFCIWGLWRWRHLMPLLPAPPWRRALRATQRRQASANRQGARAGWQLVGLYLRQMVAPPPSQPRLQRTRRAPARVYTRPVRKRQVRPRPWFKLPSLAIEFVAPDRAPRLPASVYELHQSILALVQDALQQALPAPPDVLALADGPRQLVCQLATTYVLSGPQQRAVVAALQVHGFHARWSDETLIRLSRETVMAALPRANVRHIDVLWVPVVRTRQGQIWWPLPRTQHLVLAGNPQQSLAGCLARLLALPEAHRPPLLIHDVEGRLQELPGPLATLPKRDDALAEARRVQLAHQFAQGREVQATTGQAPVLIVYAPSEEIWPDLHPLLAVGSGVQVILVPGDREPLNALRSACHRLPVVEAPDLRFPSLPDAFRPGGLPPPRSGQSLAWLPGGGTFWRGLPPDGSASVTAASEVS